MVDTPQEFKDEIKQVGRLRYHRLRRIASILHYYKIDSFTIEERLVERGASREFAMWIVRTASEDVQLAKRIEAEETPETMGQVILKGLNGAILLVIVYMVTQYIQFAESMGLLFIFSPFLLLASLIGSLMFIRAIAELRRRWADKK